MRVAAVVLIVGACSSSSHVPVDAVDQGPCLIAGTYGDLGVQHGRPGMANGAPNLSVVLDDAARPDELLFRLVAGKGVFASGTPTAGTYTIAGPETSFFDCGLCTLILADISSGAPAKYFFTTSGTVTITAAQPIAGNAQNLTFVEVDPVGGSPNPACTATISAIEFGP